MKILRGGRSAATVRFLAVALVLAAIWFAGVWLAEGLPSSPAALTREIRELGGAGPLLLAGLMVLAVVVGHDSGFRPWAEKASEPVGHESRPVAVAASRGIASGPSPSTESSSSPASPSGG